MRDELETLLTQWGNYHARRWFDRGYPTRSVFASLTDPHYFNPGHRVLYDRPPWLAPIDRMVSRIPKPDRDALTIRYCLPPIDGKLLSERQIAGYLGISRSCYRQRLYRARRVLTDAPKVCYKTLAWVSVPA